jgi:hypothetical protein
MDRLVVEEDDGIRLFLWNDLCRVFRVFADGNDCEETTPRNVIGLAFSATDEMEKAFVDTPRKVGPRSAITYKNV